LRMSSIIYNLTPAQLQFLLDTSNSYSDVLRKIGLNPKGKNPETLKKVILDYKLDITQLDINRNNLYKKNGHNTVSKRQANLDDIFSGKKNMQSSRLLKKLVSNGLKEYVCECCGIQSWNNKPISLQLHHKDGNHNNNSLDNLEVLCTNCHSQTDTFAGKNSIRKQKIKKKKQITNRQLKIPPITRNDLKSKIRNQSFVSIAEEYGVTDNAIRKWCDKYHLPRSKTVIKNYTENEWKQI